MNPDAIALPPDNDRLTGDLCAPKYTDTSDGKIKVESKDAIRKRLKRSTDGGDAVALVLSIWYLATAQPKSHQYQRLYVNYAPRRQATTGLQGFRRTRAGKIVSEWCALN